MRILILGVSGLIGHKLFQKLSARFGDVHGTLHGGRQRFEECGLFRGPEISENVDVLDFEQLELILQVINPDVVLNCAGITKRRAEVNDPLYAIAVNSLFPHKLAAWSRDHGKRVIHFSTDCVFDGATGGYTEASPTTGKDPYGQTKALGEIRYDHALTIRSSFVGRELAVHSELLDWFLQQRGKTIKGFTQAWYTGISTLEMARIVGDIIEIHPDLSGLYQLSIERPVSKYDLLCMARDAFNFDVEIVPDHSFEIRPTLDSTLLRSKIDVALPTWPDMMRSLAAEKEPYKKLS
jgi:dTDP-4-dehydrorhamnose reductase